MFPVPCVAFLNKPFALSADGVAGGGRTLGESTFDKNTIAREFRKCNKILCACGKKVQKNGEKPLTGQEGLWYDLFRNKNEWDLLREVSVCRGAAGKELAPEKG